jgi:demethylmenaquinone methyltransferase/2-methoxy-6-polyprenyl-1,4-benzoquinol methylase
MITPSRNEIWKMFNEIAFTYDRINRILSLGMDRRWRRKVCSYIPLKKDLHILDLATGTADQLIALFESSASIEKAIGVDLAQDMLTIGQEKINKKIYQQKIELINADAEKLPFNACSFDVATFSFGIRNVLNPLNSLKEMYRVLNNSGVAFILEFSLPSFPFRWGHLFYLRHILPKLGALFSNNTSAYRYLNETIETFPQGKNFCNLMEQVGFDQVTIQKMSLGAVSLYIGRKR